MVEIVKCRPPRQTVIAFNVQSNSKVIYNIQATYKYVSLPKSSLTFRHTQQVCIYFQYGSISSLFFMLLVQGFHVCFSFSNFQDPTRNTPSSGVAELCLLLKWRHNLLLKWRHITWFITCIFHSRRKPSRLQILLV